MPKKQPSSIDTRLPADIRKKFYEMIRDPRMTGLEITDRINELLEADGNPERVSKSAVYRKKARLDRIGERLKQSREMAKIWIGELGAAPQGEVGKLLNEIVRNLAFETAQDMADKVEPADPKMLRDLAIAIEKLEKAASENSRREEQIREQERNRLKDETLAAVDQATSGGHMTAETLKQKIREVYGV